LSCGKQNAVDVLGCVPKAMKLRCELGGGGGVGGVENKAQKIGDFGGPGFGVGARALEF